MPRKRGSGRGSGSRYSHATVTVTVVVGNSEEATAQVKSAMALILFSMYVGRSTDMCIERGRARPSAQETSFPCAHTPPMHIHRPRPSVFVRIDLVVCYPKKAACVYHSRRPFLARPYARNAIVRRHRNHVTSTAVLSTLRRHEKGHYWTVSLPSRYSDAYVFAHWRQKRDAVG